MRSARTPQEVHEIYASAATAGDIDTVLGLYEEDSLFVGQGGVRSEGLAEIRVALEAFQVLKPQVALSPTDLVVCGDIALTQSDWTVKGTSPDGQPVEIGGKGIEVLRRQPDGSWKFLIDHPFGAA